MFGRTCEIKRKMYRSSLSLTWVTVWDSAHQVHSRVSNVNFVLCGRERGTLEIFPVCPDVDSLYILVGLGRILEFPKSYIPLKSNFTRTGYVYNWKRWDMWLIFFNWYFSFYWNNLPITCLLKVKYMHDWCTVYIYIISEF
jgi:hypothetical protein